LQTDPIGFKAKDVNLYGYVGNDPVNLIDPEGLEIPTLYRFEPVVKEVVAPVVRETAKTVAKSAISSPAVAAGVVGASLGYSLGYAFGSAIADSVAAWFYPIDPSPLPTPPSRNISRHGLLPEGAQRGKGNNAVSDIVDEIWSELGPRASIDDFCRKLKEKMKQCKDSKRMDDLKGTWKVKCRGWRGD
jgi:uncharacterized protein RhaS with RHS repeats